MGRFCSYDSGDVLSFNIFNPNLLPHDNLGLPAAHGNELQCAVLADQLNHEPHFIGVAVHHNHGTVARISGGPEIKIADFVFLNRQRTAGEFAGQIQDLVLES